MENRLVTIYQEVDMKKLVMFLVLIMLSIPIDSIAEGFYICKKTKNCAMYVIESEVGYSWLIECMDGTMSSGFTEGAVYGGSCQKIV